MTLPTPPTLPAFAEDGSWDPDVAARLSEFLNCTREQEWSIIKDQGPFAVFDWDHTLFHGDIGDALFMFMVQHHRFFRPENWRQTSPFLTDHAIEALVRHTPPHADRLPGSGGTALARELISIYLYHHTCDGKPAFSGFNPDTTHPSYAWCASLLAGYTPARVTDLTHEVRSHLLGRPPGSTGELHGLGGWDDWGRPVGPMIKLARQLEQAGLPVWIVSASPQIVVETCAREAGLEARRVIGVRCHDHPGGALSSRLQTCGAHDDVIPYCLGKRCWIQRVIGGSTEPRCDRSDEQMRARLWFAAGDSDGDLAFLQDASRLRLVIAHRENRSVRLARENADGRWLVNSPFFDA
jgi:hypothetical protein